MNPDFRITDDRLRQMNKSQKEAKREKCFCQIKEMAYFWTPVNGCAYISSAFMPDSSRQQAQEITEPTRPVADETFDKFDDRCQKMQRYLSDVLPAPVKRMPGSDYPVYGSQSQNAYLEPVFFGGGRTSYMRGRVWKKRKIACKK